MFGGCHQHGCVDVGRLPSLGRRDLLVTVSSPLFGSA